MSVEPQASVSCKVQAGSFAAWVWSTAATKKALAMIASCPAAFVLAGWGRATVSVARVAPAANSTARTLATRHTWKLATVNELPQTSSRPSTGDSAEISFGHRLVEVLTSDPELFVFVGDCLRVTA